MRTADLHQIGSIDLTDVNILCKSYGRDLLPYPFMLTRPSRFSTRNDYLNYATSVPDRFNHGDLGTIGRWASSYADADIRVESRVQYIPADTPSVRVVAHRAGELGYLAKQRPDGDVIDVYELSPYDLGRAIADSVDLAKPGIRSGIVIPEYVPRTVNAYAGENFTVLDSVTISTASEVRRADVTAYATVQSHWRPARRWGFDRRKNAAVWVRIKNDGEYLFASEFREAKPMTRLMLAERIDKLIAADIKVLRDFRDGQ